MNVDPAMAAFWDDITVLLVGTQLDPLPTVTAADQPAA